MRIIKVLDGANYRSEWVRFKRDSVRAIIFSGEKIAMIRSEKYGEYKFPGGGIEKNELHLDTLIRETREETGLHIIPASVKEYGETNVIRKGFNDNEIFEQKSFYYLCDVESNIKSPAKLDEGYETEYKYSLVYISLADAIEMNKRLLNIPEIPWVERDLAVLLELNESLHK